MKRSKDKGDKYINKCSCLSEQPTISQSTGIVREPSGVRWVNRYPTSSSVNDLTEQFSVSVSRFINAIKNAGGNVRVSATHRPAERAYLMHYAWRIAREGLAPESVPEKEGVNIDLTHAGDTTSAISAARDMVDRYDIVFRPSLTSRHIQRRAIDMTITNIIGRSIVNGNGLNVMITSNSILYAVGASYNVHKLVSDRPHWSDDGR